MRAGASARAAGPAPRSRPASDTRVPSPGHRIRIAVTSNKMAKVTACARKTTTAARARAKAAAGRGRPASRATIPSQTSAGGNEST